MYSKKYYGACGIVRKRDFEDRHPIIAGVLALIAIASVSIVMVIL